MTAPNKFEKISMAFFITHKLKSSKATFICFVKSTVNSYHIYYWYKFNVYTFRIKPINLPTGAKVRNRVGTSKCHTKTGGGWLKFYKKNNSGRAASECRTYGCTNRAKVGAHVELPGGKGPYIIPSCQPCNIDADKKYHRVNSGTRAVPVPKKATKGPKLCYI